MLDCLDLEQLVENSNYGISIQCGLITGQERRAVFHHWSFCLRSCLQYLFRTSRIKITPNAYAGVLRLPMVWLLAVVQTQFVLGDIQESGMKHPVDKQFQ